MKPQIQFINNIEELTLPLIQLTKSKSGKTGTATFLFKYPSIFIQKNYPFEFLNGMHLLWETKEISSTDLKLFFKNGEPFLVRVIFLFKNSKEWFDFLQFMHVYSKETGLFFSETIFSYSLE
jgi:photosystem II protein